MDKFKSIRQHLKDKTGASLVFVLAVMLCLLILSVSVISAAASNAVYLQNQKVHNQLLLLDEAVHDNIMYSLQKKPEDAGFLSSQLLTALYKAHDTSNPAGLGVITLAPVLSSAGSIPSVITLSFPEQAVTIRPEIDEVLPADEVLDADGTTVLVPANPGSPRVPKTASVSAKMTVTVKTNFGSKVYTTIATYQFLGGELTDDVITNGGRWSLIKHEKADTQDA